VNYANVQSIIGSALESLRPPPDMTVSEWSDNYRRLSAESSASPGRWRTETTEYLREPMDMVGKPGIDSISLMTSAQVGKSSFVENVVGYFMHQDPCPILHVSPTLSSMKMFSKERLAPMLRDTPVLRGLVKDARSRDSENTIETKKFPGGNLALVGSNAPAGLASRPVRIVVADEVDRFERSAGTEGDPLKLAIKRTTTFWNRVIVFVSTPGNKGQSRIEEEFEAGDQRRRYCPCPDCGHMQTLKWSGVVWENNDPYTAHYTCEECGSCWNDFQRNLAVRRGEWRAAKPFNGRVSYHLSQIYSPFARLSDTVKEWLDSKDHPEKLKTFINTVLGETWEEKGIQKDWSDLLSHRVEYNHDVPSEVTLVTCGADVQDDRIELEFVGWGDDAKSWSLGYRTIYGDLSTPHPWEELKSALGESFFHPVLGEMACRMTCLDSGGHYTQSVYRFSQTVPRVTAIKGVGGAGKPMVGKPTRSNLGGSQVFPLGVDTIKELVVARLNVTDPDKPGYCTFPHDREDGYFRGLTAEKLITKFRKGFKHQEWTKVRPRNEPFDCRVYATAALEMLQVDLNAQRKSAMRQLLVKITQVAQAAPPKPKKRESAWLNKWKEN
jgi:phage terminase large subunit GpA-like protein